MRRQILIAGAVVAVAMGCGDRGDQSVPDETAAVAAPPPGGGVNASAEPFADSAPAEPSSSKQPPDAGAPRSRPPSVPVAGADSAVGTVQLLGTALDSRVVVQTPAGPIAVVGPHEPALRRLQGMDVWIRGPLSMAIGRVIPPRQITVERFEIRGVAGVPVLDGRLAADGEALTIVDRHGARTRLTNYPAELRDLVGRRVWVTRASDGAVASFGPIGG